MDIWERGTAKLIVLTLCIWYNLSRMKYSTFSKQNLFAVTSIVIPMSVPNTHTFYFIDSLY